MTYPGNPTLAPDVQQRITSTFEHTLGLAAGGSRQEALLGCDFVLRMDPQFSPAQRLQERLGATMGTVEVDDLRASPVTTKRPTAPPRTPPSPITPGTSTKNAAHMGPTALHDLDNLQVHLPDLPDLPDFGKPPAADLRSALSDLLRQRKFQELLSLAQANTAAVNAEPELDHMAQLAQERLEAGPYVVRFLSAAREAQRQGIKVEADRLIEKARSLDPSHPGIAELTGGPAEAHPFEVVDDTPEVDLSPLRTMAIPMVRDSGPAGGDAESERRITQLLDEGDAALAGGDPQAAIDAWSRIFLIDIDHQEAAKRIERARRIKAENERQVEEVYHDGLAKMEQGDSAGAKAAFDKVLSLQPTHLGAREYQQQVANAPQAPPRDAGRRTPTRGAAGPAPPPPPTPLPMAAAPARGDEQLHEEILVPPDLSEGESRAEPRRDVRSGGKSAPGRGKRMFALVGSGVLLLLLGGAWYVYQNRDQWFPNSQTEDPSGATAQVNDPIARAKHLHDTGKANAALALLRRLPPTDPHYKEAQGLIEKWEAPSPLAPAPAVADGAPAATAPTAAPTIADEHRANLLTDAQRAYTGHAYFKASEKFDQADRIAHLDGADATAYSDVQQHLLPIAKQISMFHQHDWEFVLPELWRLHQADPLNQDIRQLMVDCYYDLGVRDLQRFDSKQAADKFTEGAKLDPDDPALNHELLFAQTYMERSPDLLFRIYIKYLQLR
jgi:tetratricopeptide (TPR) repeat protein